MNSAFSWEYQASRRALVIKGVQLPDYFSQIILKKGAEESVGADDLRAFLPWGVHCPDIEIIEAPSLIAIPPAVFAWMPSLIAADVTDALLVENSAFYECPKLEVVLMPHVRLIGNSAFCGCKSLKRTSGEGREWMELRECRMLSAYAFHRCESLTSVTFKKRGTRTNEAGDTIQEAGSRLEFIGEAAFAGCNALKSVALGGKESRAVIAPHAFYRCPCEGRILKDAARISPEPIEADGGTEPSSFPDANGEGVAPSAAEIARPKDAEGRDEHLGKSAYVFFDVETPNRRNNRICSISAIAVDGEGNTLDERYWLVNPETGFDPVNTGIHGLRLADVKDSPTFPEVWDDGLRELLTGAEVLVAHNARFDLAVLGKTLRWYGIEPPEVAFIDTLAIAHGCGCEEPCTLDSLCAQFGIEMGIRHNALDDTRALRGVYYELRERFEIAGISGHPYAWPKYGDSRPSESAAVVPAMTELYGIVLGINLDGAILASEASAIKEWMEDYRPCAATPVFKECYKLLEDVLEDGMLTANELAAVLDYVRPFVSGNAYSDATRSMQELLGLLKGVLADGALNVSEAIGLRAWLRENDHLSDDSTYRTVYGAVENLLADRSGSEEGFKDVAATLDRLAHPLAGDGEAACDGAACGKVFCLSGEFESGTKDAVASRIETAGGEVLDRVTKRCDYVVVGGCGCEQYAFGNYGTKVKKAQEYKEKGVPIAVIREVDLLEMLD